VDPITLILIGAAAAAAAGLGVATPPLLSSARLRRARKLLTRPIISTVTGDGVAKSVYDVFQDLGANEVALEVMRHMGMIPESEDELDSVAASLEENIASFGGYESLVRSLRESIADIEGERRSGNRGRLTLVAPRGAEALLPAVATPLKALEAGEEVKALPQMGATGSTHATPKLHSSVDGALDDFVGALEGDSKEGLEQAGGDLAAIVIGGVLGSLTTGTSFWTGVTKFARRRQVKQMKTRLSSELSALSLDVFHTSADLKGEIDKNLSSIEQDARYNVEQHRREARRHKSLPKEQRSTSLLALKLLASQNARDELKAAQHDSRQLKSQIARHRRSGRHDLAGFLIYVNRSTLLRGLKAFDGRIEAIEQAGAHLRSAILEEESKEQ